MLVEAGHRCAVHRCGQTEIDIHHIVPWETCRKHEYKNLIALCPNCHRRVHNGQIDRRALLIYKQHLAVEFEASDNGYFKATIVESRRRIFEQVESSPGFRFQFDFPDFPNPAERIASRNIEAWGYELLVECREIQENTAKNKSGENKIGYEVVSGPSTLKGDYSIVRRDAKVISVKYVIHRYYAGAVHGSKETRVQNFLLKPFSPVTLTVLLGGIERLPLLADRLREELISRGRDDDGWLRHGTEPKVENFELFNIELSGIRFTFSEYQIDCYAAGEYTLILPFDTLTDICDPAVLLSVRNDLDPHVADDT